MNIGETAIKKRDKPRTDESDTFYNAHKEILEMVIEAKPIEAIFRETTLLVEKISPVKTWCSLKLTKCSDFSSELATAPSLPECFLNDLEKLQVEPGDGTCGQAVMQRKAIFCEEIASDPANKIYHEIAKKYGIKSCWSVPILDLNGLPLAVLTSFYHQRYSPCAPNVDRVVELCRLIRLVIERQQIAEQLLHSSSKFKAVAAATNDAIWDWDIPNDTLWWSDGFSSLFGFEGEGPGPVMQGWVERIHPDDRERVTTSLANAIKYNNRHWRCEYRFLGKNGEYAHVLEQAEVSFSSDGTPLRMVGGMSDMTQHRKAEHELKTLNRALSLLSSCNKVLIRTTDEKQLLLDICTLATKEGGYQMAWVGYADPGPEKAIIPAASFGSSDDYVNVISLSYAEDDRTGNGPGGKTIRSGKATICEDISNEDSGFFWIKEALDRGFKSLICLPLKQDNNCFGFISLLSSEVSAIGKDEENLLQELADNLAYGILTLRDRARQKRTQDTVVKVAQSVSDSFGKKFYELLTQNMVETLGACKGAIGKLNKDENTATTLAVTLDGKTIENVTYPLAGTPCNHLASEQIYIVEDNLPERFPDDHYLINLGIQSYAGIALYNSKGEPCGLLSVLFRTPLRDSAIVGSILQIFAERAASEMAREEADARIFRQASLLDKARDAIFTFDLQHRIDYWNKSASRLYGFSSEEASLKSALELLHAKPDGHEQAFHETLKHGEWIGELHQIDKTGKSLIVESRWNLVRDSKGEPKSVLVINTDVTDQKLLEQQLSRAQRLESIGTLAGGLAHDLNNVLAPIPMSVELLSKNITDERGVELLDAIAASSRRAAEMIRQVLSLASGVEGNKTTLSLEKVIRDLVKTIDETFPENIQIETDLEDGLWHLHGDSTQLHQVLLNFCINARDAMPAGGRLRISAKNLIIDENAAAKELDAHPGPYLCIEIDDTGHGIDPEIIGRIYDPFFTTKDTGKGTGLGLPTTLAIVKKHAGFIKSSSEIQKGTHFQIYLPALPGQNKTLPKPFKDTEGNRAKILLIDDEPAILAATRRTLEEFGYLTVLANSGSEAIEYFRQNHQKIDVVITDMMMPGLDGAQTIDELTKIDPAAKIIIASAHQTNENQKANLRYFLQKPFNAQEILTVLEKILNPPSSPCR